MALSIPSQKKPATTPDATATSPEATRAQDTARIDTDSQKLNTDLAQGNKKALRGDLKTLHHDFQQAHHDGFSKQDTKVAAQQVNGQALGAEIAHHIAKGGKADDAQTKGAINNAYARFCRSNGISNGATYAGAKAAFAQNVAAGMEQQGVSRANIEAALSPSSSNQIDLNQWAKTKA